MVQPLSSAAGRLAPRTAVPVSGAPSVRLADDFDADAVESPARRLQQTIEFQLSGADEPRWSARRTLAFLLVTNGLFWAGVALVVRAVV